MITTKHIDCRADKSDKVNFIELHSYNCLRKNTYHYLHFDGIISSGAGQWKLKHK